MLSCQQHFYITLITHPCAAQLAEGKPWTSAMLSGKVQAGELELNDEARDRHSKHMGIMGVLRKEGAEGRDGGKQ